MSLVITLYRIYTVLRFLPLLTLNKVMLAKSDFLHNSKAKIMEL